MLNLVINKDRHRRELWCGLECIATIEDTKFLQLRRDYEIWSEKRKQKEEGEI